MELKQYASILWRWLWLIILGAVLAAVSAYVTSRLTQPVYAASATLLINQAPSGQVSDYTAILTSERLARTYSELLKGRPVLEEVIASQKLGLTYEVLSKRVEVRLVRDTQLIELTVESEDPRIAVLVANQIPAVFSRQNEEMQSSRYAASKSSLSKELEGIDAQIRQSQEAIDMLGTPATPAGEAELARLQAELAQFRQSYASLLQSYESIRVAEAQSISNIVVVEPAAMPDKPVRPKTLLNTALAAVVGLMLAVGVVFLIEYLDDSVRSAEQASQVLQLPVIGAIARLANGKGNGKGGAKLIASSEPRSPVAEAFRSLRTNIQFSGVDKPLRTLLVTSAGPAEGKSLVSANLAVVMAQAGLRVVLLDADLRHPAAHKYLNRPNRNGVTDLVLQSAAGREGSVQETAIRNLALVSSGQLPPNPSELLGSQKMQQLLTRLAEQSDMVVIDSSPVLAVTDSAVLARIADAVLLVLDADSTRIGAALQARAQLEQVGAKLIGLVMNKIPVGRGGYYQYYRYYHYSTDEKARRPAPAGRAWLPWRWPRKPAAQGADVLPAPGAPPGEQSPSKETLS